MKKICKTVFLASVMSFATYASADTSSPWKVALGAEGQYYNYREPQVMHLAGWMAGINGEAIYTLRNNWFSGIEARVLWGKANYSSYRTGKINSEPQFLSETRVLFGQHWRLNATTTLSPYTGLGYRYKSDSESSQKSTTGHYSYKRQSCYLYLPVGVKYQTSLNSELSLAIRGEGDYLISGKQKSDVNLNGQTVDNTQNSGFGAKASVEVIKKLNNNQVISFGPYFHYWDIKDSEVTTIRGINLNGTVTTRSYLEPHNKSYEAGMSVKYHF